MDNKFFSRIFLAGFLYAIIAQITHTIGAVLSMSFYQMPEYFAVWSKIMMPGVGPPPPIFMAYGVIFGFITGLLFAYVYYQFKTVIKGKNYWHKGTNYGMILFMLAGIPASLMLILLINLPLTLIFAWTIESLIAYIIGGIIIARIIK